MDFEIPVNSLHLLGWREIGLQAVQICVSCPHAALAEKSYRLSILLHRNFGHNARHCERSKTIQCGA